VTVLHENEFILFDLRIGLDTNETALVEYFADEVGISKMSTDSVTQVQVLDAFNLLDVLQARNTHGEAVSTIHETKNQIILRVNIEDLSRNNGTKSTPVRGCRGSRSANDDNRINETEGLSLSKRL
jgi:hypothetical protein